jgi:hypothetical protein
MDGEISHNAVYLKTMLLDGAQVLAAGDENYVFASLRQPAAKVATYAPNAENCDAHECLLQLE